MGHMKATGRTRKDWRRGCAWPPVLQKPQSGVSGPGAHTMSSLLTQVREFPTENISEKKLTVIPGNGQKPKIPT